MQKICKISVVVAHHDEPIPEPFLPPENLTERHFKRWKSRRMANFLLKKLLAEHGLDPNLTAQIHRAQNGRPYLEREDIDFNISHSGDWVAIIFSKAAENQPKSIVGIDLEHPQKMRRFEPLIRHYADEIEVEQLLHSQNPEPKILPELEQRFYLSWCLREAVLKSQGVGIIKLSEVTHRPNNLTLQSQYCPKGRLEFFYQFPFFLAYFFEDRNKYQLERLEWKAGKLQKMADFPPLVYQVN